MKTEYNKAYYEGIEEERTRIARELHDGPVQIMTHIGHKLEFVQCLLAKQAVASAQSELQQIHAILGTCLQALRTDISSLMITTPQNIGGALQTLLEAYEESNPTIRLTYISDDLYQLPVLVTYPLFTFVQEALQNVRKHAHATEVELRIHLTATSLLAEVCDNGIGLKAAKQQDKNTGQHMGMHIMWKRVQEVGGTVEFESNLGKGTCARAIFPLVVA